MNESQKTSQTSPPNDPTYQPGQQGGRVDDSGSSQGGAGGQDAAGPSREVSSAGQQGGQLSRAQATTTVLPPVDIFEDESGFTVIADMPGVSKDQLNVRVTGDSLLIEGTALVPDIGSMELVYGEVQIPQYRRSFTLSRELDPGKIEASLNNGVLRLRIPKGEEAKPRRIDVSAS